MNLKDRLLQAGLGLDPVNDFSSHESDLYVRCTPEVWAWLQKNYAFISNCKTFINQITHTTWIDIPFANDKEEQPYNYYRDQLRGIEPGRVGTHQATIKIRHKTGETKWLSLNNESVAELTAWLNTHYTASGEIIDTLVGVTQALQRVIDKYNPDDNNSEWVGEANEIIVKLTGKDLRTYVKDKNPKS
jgi:hypothetical protein